jgi:DNA-binding NarL/FixJ family response regulator
LADPLIRLVLAEDHAIVLHGLQQLFQQHADMEVVGCCSNGEAALAAMRRTAADVLVLDLRMPGLSGLEVLRTLAAEGAASRCVVLTAAISDADAAEAIRLGAGGLVLKELSPDTLVSCVRSVSRGERWIEPRTFGRAFDHESRRQEGDRTASGALTPREIEIVRLIAAGHRNRSVAAQLAISEGTVKIHLHNIYEKLGVDGRLELALWAQAEGVV